MDTNPKNKNLSACPPTAKAFGEFYKTKRGCLLDEEITKSLAVDWGKKIVSRCHVLSIGYPPPGIKKIFKKAESYAVLSPASLGENPVRVKGLNVSAVVDEVHLPLRQGSYDAAFVFHALEYMEDPISFLEGLWKVMPPSGRITIMVPNKRAGWKQSGVPGVRNAAPFLYRGIKSLLEKAGFSLTKSYGVFYGLPVGFLQTLLFSGLLKALSGGSLAGLPGFMLFEAKKDTGLQKVKMSEPLKNAPGVRATPGLIPE